MIPVYDTLRVIVIRLSRGVSPFSPDKKHIHHTLIRQGFNHAQASLILIGYTLFAFILTTQISFLGQHLSLIFLTILSITFGAIWDVRLQAHLKAQRDKAGRDRSLRVSKSA